MWIERRLTAQLLSAARQFPALVVTGGRQNGKTTLLRHLFPDASFASLDLPSAAYQADERGAEFLQGFPEPVILDEVQYAPGLFRYLKVAIDAEESPGARRGIGCRCWKPRARSSCWNLISTILPAG